jgi:hypothetical protein
MTQLRTVRSTSESVPTMEGGGVRLRRVFGFGDTPGLDPFLLLDDFRGDNPDDYRAGFPWHPHRGIETITYVLEGKVEHGDSLGNRGTIGPGDVQWMTAGGGIIHQEMPEGDARGRMGGFQLWANLPRAQKMMEPRYREVPARELPEAVLAGGVRIRVLAGSAAGLRGPIRDILTDPLYVDLSAPPGARFVQPIPRGHTVFAFVFEGRACFPSADGADDTCVGEHSLVVLGDGDTVRLTTRDEAARLLLVAGKPLGEPVAWRGPIVMNTEAELEQAFEDYRNGTFARMPAR